MANLEITNICNLQCDYCFARDSMESNRQQKNENHISIEAFKRHLDFLDRSDIDQVRLIGGEPTLHPQFGKIIEIAHLKGKHILVFSNGLMPSASLKSILNLQMKDCTVLVNMSSSHNGMSLTDKEMERRNENIKKLGQRVIPGINIHTTDFDLAPLFPIILELNCRKKIRLGVAHPSISGNNQFLHPKQFPVAGRKIAEAAELAKNFDIQFDFDCGFVRCMFTASEMNTLIQAKANFGSRCNPVLDISISGEAIHCYPLAGRGHIQLTDQIDADFCRETLSEKNQHFRSSGIYPECSTCRFKENGECTGGCLASTIRRFNQLQN